MNPKEYIQTKLAGLKVDFNFAKIPKKNELKAEIFRQLMSKKFRKYGVEINYQQHIKKAIGNAVKKNEPIQLNFPFGGYKLWRFSEAPRVDWAELFAIIYYTNWLKPICEIYEPGVWLDFHSDEVIVPRMNNIKITDTNAYLDSFKGLIIFFQKYIPQNLKITLSRVIEQYETAEEFEVDLRYEIDQIQAELDYQMPVLNDQVRAMIELNVKLKKRQEADPFWREKIDILHQGYLRLTEKRPYFRNDDKIIVSPMPSFPNTIAVGTTKHSVAKFWCGIGVLEKDEECYNQIILTPNQIKAKKLKRKEVCIDGLVGKNFKAIGIL